MGNSHSLTKSINRSWTSDPDTMETIRHEVEEHLRSPSRQSPMSSKAKKTKNAKDSGDLGTDDIVALHKLIDSLKADKEGQQLLKRFIERQVDLEDEDESSLPPINDIVIPTQPKTRKHAGNRAA